MQTSESTTERSVNTAEMFAQHWPQLRQQVKAWWDRLSDADLEQVAGHKEQLIRMIQARYGYARERAEQEVDRRLGEVSDTIGTVGVGRLAEAVGEAGTRAQKMATTAATTIAGTAARASSFLPELPGGFVGLIRRYPMPSLLVGMGVGFLLGRSLARSWWLPIGEANSHQSEVGFPEALMQCTRCGQMVRQADMVSHSTTCSGPGVHSQGGSPA
jgi:uncharacterized protein YjbJ (UPF0337 family)